MNINKAFPSNYLKAADLEGKTPNVTIASIETETVGDDTKLVVYFKNGTKGLVLNKTNANTIAEILNTEETDNWIGGRIKLITAKVEYQGKRVPAIRIETPDSNGGKPAPAPVRHAPVRDVPTDDEIPF